MQFHGRPGCSIRYEKFIIQDSIWLIRLTPGIVLGMIALADVRWLLPCGLLWIAYAGWQKTMLDRIKPNSLFVNDQKMVTNAKPRPILFWIVLGLQGLLAVMIAAPLILPLLQFTQLSTRSQLTASEAFNLSLPLYNLLGLLFPNPGSNAEWVLFPGAITIVLVFVTLLASPLRRKSFFWLGIGLVSIFFSLGFQSLV